MKQTQFLLTIILFIRIMPLFGVMHLGKNEMKILCEKYLTNYLS